MKKTVIISILGVLALSSCKKDKNEPVDTCTTITNNSLALGAGQETFHGLWVKQEEYTSNCYEKVATSNYLPNELRFDFYSGLEASLPNRGMQYNAGEDSCTTLSDMTMQIFTETTASDPNAPFISGDGVRFDDHAISGMVQTSLEYCTHYTEGGSKYIIFKDVTGTNLYGTSERHYVKYKRVN